MKIKETDVFEKLTPVPFQIILNDQILHGNERVLQETREYIQSIQEISPEKRVYMDESFIYDNEAPSMDRSMRGKHISRPRKRHGKRWTFYLAIRSTGIVYDPLISSESAKDETF
ncbi:hypothetical protein HK099_000429 [Clydaea vesicula]|uniref:Transposase n=1 Tax=Clydaea vesicula TaxID=447962 RepID=A0AAD5XZ44_9FUNG|nr:hypothetical protein HK099_000429 [Clydaea vesicula]